MEKKQSNRIDAKDELIKVRQENLDKINSTSLRPHGKLWGMDVFSWFNSEPWLLANTIQAMPFPVIWITDSKEVLKSFVEDERSIQNIDSLITYNNSVVEMGQEWLDEIPNSASTSNSRDAFRMLELFKSPKKVLLFTASGDDWEQEKWNFEEFLKTVKV
jgi:hypothetical protein